MLTRTELGLAQRVTLDEFDAAFDRLSEAALVIRKVEVLQDYVEADNPAWQLLVAGRWDDAVAKLDDFYEESKEYYDGLAARGAVLRRLRLLTRPLTRYVQFELEAYRIASELGEQISILDCTGGGLGEWSDCLIFDDAGLLLHDYVDGVLVGGSLVEDEVVIARYRERFDRSSAMATPYAEYYRTATQSR
ncbi:hypothetical protein LRS13_12590 [Svornostia abyssi]|uniref:DUF6879 domain-containing protein n=1 Tax=Svornostia abyssi TaxID=2898438 RepID=A0ABY5PAK6_9ACTN|nr:hypothetical protein LRS13_12590 [Parviterribacteraceae bacterium J379]